MNEMKEAGVAEYTMGSALFNANFVKDGTFRENLEFVLDYLKKYKHFKINCHINLQK